MANVPILSLETTIFLEEEVDYIQLSTSLSNGSIITLDNSGNIERYPIINIILNNTFLSGFTITNQTTGVSIAIPPPETNYSEGTLFTIYGDSVYIGSTEINATFSAPFVIAENIINIILFTLPGGFTIDATVQWTRPDQIKREELYVQGFSVNQNETLNKKQVNKLKKTTSGYYSTETNFDFSIDKLFYDNFYFDLNSSKSYRISWQTDTSISDISHITKYLCGCKFSSIGISQGEVELVKEGLRGNACKLF